MTLSTHTHPSADSLLTVRGQPQILLVADCLDVVPYSGSSFEFNREMIGPAQALFSPLLVTVGFFQLQTGGIPLRTLPPSEFKSQAAAMQAADRHFSGKFFRTEVRTSASHLDWGGGPNPALLDASLQESPDSFGFLQRHSQASDSGRPLFAGARPLFLTAVAAAVAVYGASVRIVGDTAAALRTRRILFRSEPAVGSRKMFAAPSSHTIHTSMRRVLRPHERNGKVRARALSALLARRAGGLLVRPSSKSAQRARRVLLLNRLLLEPSECAVLDDAPGGGALS